MMSWLAQQLLDVMVDMLLHPKDPAVFFSPLNTSTRWRMDRYYAFREEEEYADFIYTE